MITIALVAIDGMFSAGFGAIVDVFALSNLYITRQYSGQETRGPTLETRVVTLNGGSVRAFDGRVVNADRALQGRQRCDLIYLPSFHFDSESLDARLAELEPLIKWLRNQHEQGAMIAASTSTVMILARAGLLDGRAATLPWYLEAQLKQRHPQVKIDTTERVTEADGIFCSGSMSAEFPLALRLVARLLSDNVADWVAKLTMVDGHADETAAGSVFSPQILRKDALVGKAQHWLQQRFSSKPRITDLAAALAVSERTLVRHFEKTLGMTPLRYLQTLRIEAAKQMLTRSNRRIERISFLVGYSDPKFFKKVFRDKTGQSPSEFRRMTRAGRDITIAQVE